MTIYRFDSKQIDKLDPTTLAEQDVLERELQKHLRSRPDAISLDTIIVAEEFGNWENSRRSIDLLGLHKDGSLVVIELKRDKRNHMELQAIRYAAMISALTFDDLVETYEGFLKERGDEPSDARQKLLDHLNGDEPDEEQFDPEAQFNSEDITPVKIVLVSTEFSDELITSVMWLRNVCGVDIKCVRMIPYTNDGQKFLDVQTIVPFPEATDFQIRFGKKKKEVRKMRSRERQKYNVSIDGEQYKNQGKRWMIFKLVSYVLKNGEGTPRQVMDAIPRKGLFEELDGNLSAEQVSSSINQKYGTDAYTLPPAKRFFCDDDEQVFHFDGKTYVFTNQWGNKYQDPVHAASQLKEAFPHLKIEFTQSE